MKAALMVIAVVGAANSEATEEQRDRLREEALPPLSDKSLPASEAYAAVVRKTGEIMGPGWRPKGEWDDWLVALLSEEE